MWIKLKEVKEEEDVWRKVFTFCFINTLDIFLNLID